MKILVTGALGNLGEENLEPSVSLQVKMLSVLFRKKL